MADSDILNATKRSVGLSLAGAAGEVCMRTRCQDIIPKQLSKTCRYVPRRFWGLMLKISLELSLTLPLEFPILKFLCILE